MIHSRLQLLTRSRLAVTRIPWLSNLSVPCWMHLVADINTILSGSRDGSAIVYTLRSGQYMRTVQHPSSACVDLVALSSSGAMVLYSLGDGSLHSYTMNHRLNLPPLASVAVGERLNTIVFSSSSDVLLSAGEAGRIVLRRPHDLAVLHELRALTEESPGGPGPLRCLTLSAMEDFVLAGTQRGTLLVWSSPMKIASDLMSQLAI